DALLDAHVRIWASESSYWRNTLQQDPKENLLKVVTTELEDMAREAEALARRRLMDIVGYIAERFRADAAWLFVKEFGELIARITHRTQERDLCVKIEERSIVSHVAKTGHGYFTNDALADNYYRRDRLETRSEITVPLNLGGELLGVLNLESHKLGAFTAAHLEDLQAASGELIPNLTIFNAVRGHGPSRCPWQPRLHGWDMQTILGRVSHAVADHWGPDSLACAVWHADWPKDELFVNAACGYDYDYVKESTLPATSLTGSVAAGASGTCECSTPDDARFVRRDKAEDMDLQRLCVAAIHTPEQRLGGRGWGALSICSFGEKAIPPRTDEVLRLADLIGDLVASFDAQRQEVAAAYLRYQLYAKSRPSDLDFETIEHVLAWIFDADVVSIFARE